MSKKNADLNDGWSWAVEMAYAYSRNPGKTDAHLRKLPSNLSSSNRRICQSLFLGYIRHRSFIHKILQTLAKRKIRPKLHALLSIALFEIIDSTPERTPKIIHHGVNQAKSIFSKAEGSFVNALLRNSSKVIEGLKSSNGEDWASWAAIYHSHPQWLVDHWVELHGQEVTNKILESNQQPPSIYIRKLKDDPAFESELLESTPWTPFYRFSGGDWSVVERLLNEAKAYIQDPSTRHVIELLKLQANQRVLDICSAPGGKAVSILSSSNPPSELVCVDLPGNRIIQLKENLAKFPKVPTQIIESDALELDSSIGLFDSVILDAPCSNTGVLRRRVDAKWRLKVEDFTLMPKIQLELLCKAAEFVKPKGVLIYSTCSIEPCENIQVVEQFLAKMPKGAWKLEDQRVDLPTLGGPDGAGAFRLSRTVIG